HLVSDAGFQLSSLATAGILAWATRFNVWLGARAKRLPGWLVECLAVSLVGGLATLAGASGVVATLLGLPAWFLLSVMVGIVQGAAGLPFASATLEPPWNGVAASLAAAGVLAAAAGRRLAIVDRWRQRRAARRTQTTASNTGPTRRPVKTSFHEPRNRELR